MWTIWVKVKPGTLFYVSSRIFRIFLYSFKHIFLMVLHFVRPWYYSIFWILLHCPWRFSNVLHFFYFLFQALSVIRALLSKHYYPSIITRATICRKYILSNEEFSSLFESRSNASYSKNISFRDRNCRYVWAFTKNSI